MRRRKKTVDLFNFEVIRLPVNCSNCSPHYWLTHAVRLQKRNTIRNIDASHILYRYLNKRYIWEIHLCPSSSFNSFSFSSWSKTIKSCMTSKPYYGEMTIHCWFELKTDILDEWISVEWDMRIHRGEGEREKDICN